jgi:hypothetical protein
LSHETLDESGDDLVKHIYAPPTVRSKEEFMLWADYAELENSEIQYQRTYYKLQKYFISRVPANHEWFMKNLPAIREVWEKIVEGRTSSGNQKLRNIQEAKRSGAEQRKEAKTMKTATIETIEAVEECLL